MLTFLVKVTIKLIAAHSANDMFSWYEYLIVNLVFSNLGFWSENLFLIAPFPDRCLLVPFMVHLNNHAQRCLPFATLFFLSSADCIEHIFMFNFFPPRF